MAGGDGLLEELEHVLQDLDARVEQVDALRDLEVPARGVVQGLQVRVRLLVGASAIPGCNMRGEARAHPEDLLQSGGNGGERAGTAAGQGVLGYVRGNRAPSRQS